MATKTTKKRSKSKKGGATDAAPRPKSTRKFNAKRAMNQVVSKNTGMLVLKTLAVGAVGVVASKAIQSAAPKSPNIARIGTAGALAVAGIATGYPELGVTAGTLAFFTKPAASTTAGIEGIDGVGSDLKAGAKSGLADVVAAFGIEPAKIGLGETDEDTLFLSGYYAREQELQEQIAGLGAPGDTPMLMEMRAEQPSVELIG